MIIVNKEEYIKEKIKFLTEYLKILWIVLIAVSGGTASLFIKLDSPIKAILLLIGIVLIVMTSSIILLLTIEIFRLLEILKDGGNKNE
ncbi:hypothetical protein JCM9492_00300 [Aquifex pyrophilus]